MKNKLTLYLLADGARPDVFKRLLDEGQLPNIQREIIDRGTYRTATSVFPTTTGPAYLPMLNGAFPGTMNVTGIRWFDKAAFFKGAGGMAFQR
jgi:predicted AlkP superfamily pyrophosphatase or phosphodiesterase